MTKVHNQVQLASYNNVRYSLPNNNVTDFVVNASTGKKNVLYCLPGTDSRSPAGSQLYMIRQHLNLAQTLTLNSASSCLL